MRRILMMALVLVLSVSAASADVKQTVTIDGANVDKQVSRLKVDGDNVVLTFIDGTNQTVDMGSVRIAIKIGEGGASIKEVTVGEGKGKRVYTLTGKYAGKSVNGKQKGVYVVDGKKRIVK